MNPEVCHLKRISNCLARTVSTREMAGLIAQECQAAMLADAVYVYVLTSDDHFEMLAAIGCTPEFTRTWSRVPKNVFPLVRENRTEEYFIGSANDFKSEVPSAKDFFDQSGRQVVFYAPLMADGHLTGLIGFSYNQKVEFTWDRESMQTLLHVFGLAIEHSNLWEQLQCLKKEAECANRAKTEFLANMSHEIRTPLGVIQGYGELLHDCAQLTAEQQRWAQSILRNTRLLTGIIGDVLDVANIEAEKMEVEYIPVALSEFLAEIEIALQGKALEKRISLHFKTENLPHLIYSDPIRLRQILLNVIGNAVKFTLKGRVDVFAQFLKGNRLQFLVQDTGIGIAPEYHEKIFEPFVQVDLSTQRQYSGTGLGLSIAKHLANAMGGDLKLLRSTPDHGSTFVIELDAVEVWSHANCHSTAEKAPRRQPLKGMHILLVEDSLDNQCMIRELLRQEGATVDVADNGREGIKKALSGEYTIILMDIQMPELDGTEAVAHLRAKGYRKPIAALTANAIRAEKERALCRGFDEYLTKPVDRPTLVQTVQRLTG